MERKIGEIFTYNDKLYQVVESAKCDDCAFMKNANCNPINEILGDCAFTKRTDNTSVIFKEVKKYMEIKNNQLTIDIPEGHIIDVEHSDLSKGIIKFKKNNITLEDIPCIVRNDIKINGFISKGSIYYSYLKKLKALATLVDIANYYNKGWKPNWSNIDERKFYIYYYVKGKTYSIDYNVSYSSHIVYFENREDAQAVIDNPNFREILDTIYRY